ncbi:hypothetical protein D1872_342240 [compost metagenome]
MKNVGSNGNQFHDRKVRPMSAKRPVVWVVTIAVRFMLPETISTITNTKPIAISYEIICADARIAPRNAYFEFDAQPATITP